MEVRISTDKPLPDSIMDEIEAEFGESVILDREEPEDLTYYVGEEDDDRLTRDECVRLCGWLYKRDLSGWIVDNGPWAQGMISTLDFSSLATSKKVKLNYARISAIFWNEADPEKVKRIKPQPQKEI